MPSKWVLQESNPAAESLAKSIGVSGIFAQVLWNRGIRDADSASKFLSCQLRDLADPFRLDGIQAGVERVFKAIEQGEKIVLYGDYDVDGVTSVAIMKRVLNDLGAQNVRAFLPDRFDEGYGLTEAGVKRCLSSDKPQLLLVLDCGTNSCKEVNELTQAGVDVIILDHHEAHEPSKPHALINYKRKSGAKLDSEFLATEYCTAGLVFKFCHALLKLGRSRNMAAAQSLDLKEYLDLVALATIADIAPLTGENRILARHGLKQMGATRFPGMKALMKVSGIQSALSGYDCGFKLGPRLNASGRLESAMASLELLLTEQDSVAMKLAEQLDAINRERQAEEARVLLEARKQAEKQFKDPESRVLVLSGKGWHEGVVGIVASRIVREFHMPAFVIAHNEDGTGKGSGRSVEGFNMAKAIDATREKLLRGGGHAMAAGVSLQMEKIEEWRKSLQEHAKKEQGMTSRLDKILRIDSEVKAKDLTLKLAEELEQLEPCGMANVRPLFLCRELRVAEEPKYLGSEGKHLKLRLSQDRFFVDAIGFGLGEFKVKKGDLIHAVFEFEVNEYLGKRKIQLNMREFQIN